MNIGKVLMVVLIIGLVLLVGCSSSAYDKPPAAPTGQFVGGGCGVAGVQPDVSNADFQTIISNAEAV